MFSSCTLRCGGRRRCGSLNAKVLSGRWQRNVPKLHGFILRICVKIDYGS